VKDSEGTVVKSWTSSEDVSVIEGLPVGVTYTLHEAAAPEGYAAASDDTTFIITDGMEMGAITQQYTSAEAAVGSIQAGVDIVLGPRYFTEAFDAVMAAVKNGTISEDRINQSVRRILKLKASGNIL
jgi:hypothetical protein